MSPLPSLEPGNHRLTCPSCGRGSKDRTFGVTVEPDGTSVSHCFRCEYVATYRPDRAPTYRPGKTINRPVAAIKPEFLSTYGLEHFARCTGLRATIGEQYLLARGCAIPPADGDLRFHPALKHPASDYTGPALVALVTHAVTRAPLTLHRSWVRSDGRKAEIEPKRMLLGGHAKRHGVIRLWPDESVTYGLAVAEGIETALSLAHAYSPVWSCVDAGNLAALPVLQGIETLVIGADHDAAGINAASRCADRWAITGVDVRVIAPATAKRDWNDPAAAA